MKQLLYLILLIVSLPLTAQVSGNLYHNQVTPTENNLNAVPNNETIALSVSGLLNAEPDVFVACFHIMQVGETAERTDSLMNARIDKFRDMVNTLTTDSIAISTDMISFVPKYAFHMISKLFSKSYNQVPDGFELQKNVMVRYRSATELDAIVSAAAKAEIYDLVKVDYFLNDVKKQYDQLRVQCMDALKAKIKSCETMGIKTDLLRKTFAEDFSTVLPQTRYGSYQAIAKPSLDAVRKSSPGSSKLTSVELSPSTYYDAVPYSKFDVVINPVVDKPMVQLSYRISIMFILPPVEPTNDLLIITPSGQLQKVTGLQR